MKVTDAKARYVRILFRTGSSRKELAELLGISYVYVCKIIRRERKA